MSKSRLRKFCVILKESFHELEHILLSDNNFPSEFDYFIVAAKKLTPQIKTIDNTVIDDAYIQRIEK